MCCRSLCRVCGARVALFRYVAVYQTLSLVNLVQGHLNVLQPTYDKNSNIKTVELKHAFRSSVNVSLRAVVGKKGTSCSVEMPCVGFRCGDIRWKR
jgi:hypothetical protein